MSDLAVVVLNWNCAHDTRAAVAHLLEDARQATVVVVDNGSQDWEREFAVLGELENLTIVRRDDNGGYAAGMNTGMRAAQKAGCTHAALVNADARPDMATLERLFRLSRERGFAVVGTAQTGPDGERYVTAAVGDGLFPKEFECAGCAAGYHVVAVVSGATMVVDLEVIQRIGWMDESFFHYAEEIDMCIRVARDARREVGWSCRTEVPHAVGGSMPLQSAQSHYYRARNKLLLVRKHCGSRWWVSPRLVKDELVYLTSAARDGQIRAWWSGVVQGVHGRTGKVS